MIDIDGKLFAVVSRFASTDTETRSYICGVRIEPYPGGGALLIATDGCRLMVARDISGACSKPATLRFSKAQVRSIKPAFGDWPRITVDKDGAAKIGADLSPVSVLVKGAYPAWRECVPVRLWRNVPSNFNAQYLIEFAKAAQSLGVAPSSLRIIGGDNEGDGALILFSQFEHAFGILMPMKVTMPKGALPRWMMPVMAKSKATKSRKVKK